MATAISELTGETVNTSSEAWRHECECRYILELLKVKGAGPDYVRDVEKRRGSAAAMRLFDDVMKLKKLRKERG